MSYDSYSQQASRLNATEASTFDAGLRQHMLRVYNSMSIGLAVSGVVAFLAATFLRDILFTAKGFSIFGLVAAFSPLLFLMIGFRPSILMQKSATQLNGRFMLFCGVMGLSLSSVLVHFTGESVARVFFVTAATFAGMSLYGYTTKRDLSKMGSFLMMGVIGIMIASLANIFFNSSMLSFVISVIGLLVFIGLTAYDTQNIKQMYAASYGTEANNKAAVLGALSLYMNFINIFQFLLQFMGDRR
ncbi:MAG: Bax inhibitor-1/YccA family protein [Alphaproteobacteria bacterium]